LEGMGCEYLFTTGHKPGVAADSKQGNTPTCRTALERFATRYPTHKRQGSRSWDSIERALTHSSGDVNVQACRRVPLCHAIASCERYRKMGRIVPSSRFRNHADDPGPNRSQSSSRMTTHRPGFDINGLAAAARPFGFRIGRPFDDAEPPAGSRIPALGGVNHLERVTDIGI